MKRLASILDTAFIAGMFLLLIFGLNSLPSCKNKRVHNATVLENGDRTYIYGDVHKGDTVWVNMDTHEVDNEYADVMQCVITN